MIKLNKKKYMKFKKIIKLSKYIINEFDDNFTELVIVV